MTPENLWALWAAAQWCGSTRDNDVVYNLQQGLGRRSQTFDLKIPGADGAELELDLLAQMQRALHTIPLSKGINHTNNPQTEM